MDSLPNLTAGQGASLANLSGAGLALAGGAIARAQGRDRASDLRAAGRFNARQVRREGRREVARFRAGVGKRGVRLRGSPRDVTRSALAQFELAAMQEEMTGRHAGKEAEQQGQMALLSSVLSAASFLGRPGAFEILRRPRQTANPLSLTPGRDFRPSEPGRPY